MEVCLCSAESMERERERERVEALIEGVWMWVPVVALSRGEGGKGHRLYRI
jgi:hypothetical protein